MGIYEKATLLSQVTPQAELYTYPAFTGNKVRLIG